MERRYPNRIPGSRRNKHDLSPTTVGLAFGLAPFLCLPTSKVLVKESVFRPIVTKGCRVYNTEEYASFYLLCIHPPPLPPKITVYSYFSPMVQFSKTLM